MKKLLLILLLLLVGCTSKYDFYETTKKLMTSYEITNDEEFHMLSLKSEEMQNTITFFTTEDEGAVMYSFQFDGLEPYLSVGKEGIVGVYNDCEYDFKNKTCTVEEILTLDEMKTAHDEFLKLLEIDVKTFFQWANDYISDGK